MYPGYAPLADLVIRYLKGMTDLIWNTGALKEYLDSHLAQMRAEIIARISDQHREHDKFELSVHEALLKQNEFRGALSDLGKTMATRLEINVVDEKYSARIGRVESIQAKIAGALILISIIIMPVVVLLTFFLAR